MAEQTNKKPYNNKPKNYNKQGNNKRPYIKSYTPPVQTANKIKNTCEYEMSNQLAATILKDNKTGDVQKILCDYVNTQCGLLKECVRVVIS